MTLGNGNIGIGSGGGGVAADMLTIRDSAITGNHSSNGGGGVYAFTSLAMTSSTVSGNSAASGSAIDGGSSAISSSTISGNTGNGLGGGPITIDNSTISGNSGDGVETDSIAAYFVTITANSGAGLRLDVSVGNNAVAEFDETLIVNNAPGAPFVHDLETSAARPITGTFNYFGTVSAVGLNDLINGVRMTPSCAPINLGPLANNGGGTQTHALLAGSCLIDAGGIVSPGGFLFANDQRGGNFPRFFNTHADIGAFEFQGGTAPVNGACGSDNGQTLLAAPVNLCSAGSASAVSGSGHPWAWMCNSTSGGSNANCTATIRTWTVNAAVAGSGGTVAPASKTVDNGTTTSVTATAAPGYLLASASGCGSGTLAGNVYSTPAITADCTISVAFTAVAVAPAVSAPTLSTWALYLLACGTAILALVARRFRPQ